MKESNEISPMVIGVVDIFKEVYHYINQSGELCLYYRRARKQSIFSAINYRFSSIKAGKEQNKITGGT